MYKWKYETPAGYSNILMSSDSIYLTGLWFEDSSDSKKHIGDYKETKLPIFEETIKWLDIYFSGQVPSFTPKYKIDNLTPFRKMVIDIMCNIDYGRTVTYNDIALEIARKRGISKMSAQAVGGAVGWNPICIIIPCHRVIGSDGSLVGYGGGINNKRLLLEHEKILTVTVGKSVK